MYDENVMNNKMVRKWVKKFNDNRTIVYKVAPFFFINSKEEQLGSHCNQ